MKPLTHCPHCKSILVKKTIPEELNNMKYENCSQRCVVDYFQYYYTSYEDQEIEYASFGTADGKLNMYYYTNNFYYPVNTLMVYSNAELKKYGKAGPFLTLKDFIVDFDKLPELQEKLSIYAIFS